MDIDTAFLLRAIERLLAVAIGGLAIYLGYRLFLRVPERREGEGQFKLWDVTIILSRIGPGVFFALFGAAVVGLSLYKGVTAEMGDGMRAQPGHDTGSPMTPAAPGVRFSGIGALPDDSGERRADARALLRRDIAILNNVLPRLRADLPEQDRTQLELAIPRIKFALMQAVWDENVPGWGDPARFEAWLREGPETPPAEIAAAVDYFRYAAPGAGP